MLSHIIENAVCFNFNRKPNLWWRNSPWSLPLFLAMPSLQFPAEWWIELLRTKRLSLWCRFQPQLLSPTSLCRWHWSATPEWGHLCRVVRVSLRWCVAHSPGCENLFPSWWHRGQKAGPSFPPSILLCPFSLPPSLCVLTPFYDPFFSSSFLSFPPRPGTLQSDCTLLGKKTMLFCSRNFIIISKQINKGDNFRQ